MLIRASSRAPGDVSDIGRAAIRALYEEVALHPKPGLVSPFGTGAHNDMDISTFLRSLNALRPYFQAIAEAGFEGAAFAVLQSLGIEAERLMLEATGGVNTHRGAIFTLGLLAAAAGFHRGETLPLVDLGATVAHLWGPALVAMNPTPPSHGRDAVTRYGARGAREEAIAGFPTLFELVLPVFRRLLRTTDPASAGVQTLFAAMATLDDTNLLHRGGPEGLAFVQSEAQRFLDQGGVFAEGWEIRARTLHHACVDRNLSPGGSADLLASAIFVEQLEQGPA